MLGAGLLGLEHHDAIVGDLLLTEDRSLRAVDEKVAERIVSTLSKLRQSQGIVLEKTQTGTEHDGELPERDALKHARLLVVGVESSSLVCPRRKPHVCMHLRRIREVSDTRLHGKHGLDATGRLLDARLHIRDLLEAETEFVLVLLENRVLLMPDGDRGSGVDDEGKLVADEVLERVHLVIHQTTNAIREMCLNCFPFHGTYRVDSGCKSNIRFEQ